MKIKKPLYKKKKFYFLILPLIVILIGMGVLVYKIGPGVQSAIRTGYVQTSRINKNSLNTVPPTQIIDRNGQVIKKINTEADLRLNTKDINPVIKNGFVAVEDRRFYKHHGVDLYGTTRAMVSHFILRRPLQGGSTITQQVARNVILHSQAQTYSRKITEMVVAQELEKKFSKDEILTSYINNSYFGRGATGVQAAAHVYLNKDQKDLTVREAAMIIGLTNNPTLYDPVDNPDVSKKKIDVTLGTLYANKVISKAEYKKAMKEKINIQLTPINNDIDFSSDYAASYAMHNAAEALAVENGFQLKYKFGSKEEYNQYHENYGVALQSEIDRLVAGGYDIHTSIDNNVQHQVIDNVNRVLEPYQGRDGQGKLMPQVSATVIDNQSGDVVAVIGGRTTDGDYYNRAFQSFRQPGSSAKPILAYAPAFEKGDTPSTPVMDSQVEQYPSVRNFSGRFYNSNISVREALRQSLNTPALREAMKVPVSDLTDKLAKMRFSRIAPDDENHIISIGGFTNGVSTSEMAGAYATFANGGQYVPVSNVTSITNASTQSVLYTNDHKKTPVYTPSASYMILDAMKSVVGGPTVFAPVLSDSYPKNLQAIKTGTTDNNRDSYLANVNYYYSQAVWIGNDNGENLSEPQTGLAMIVNKAISDVLMQGKEPKDFTKPDNVSKNGDDLRVTGPEAPISNKKSQRAEAIKKNYEQVVAMNNARLDDMDYRIKFGLSTKEEQKREQKVLDLIDRVNDAEFNSVGQYKKLQTLMSKAVAANIDVKHTKKKDELTTLINQAQTNLTARYTELQVADSAKNNSDRDQTIQDAKNKKVQENSGKIDELINTLNNQKSSLLNAFKNNRSSEGKDVAKKMADTIKELNSLGRPTPAFYILTDGSGNAELIEGPTPNLNMN